MKTFWFYIIAALILGMGILGFFIGRATINEQEDNPISYINGIVIHDTITIDSTKIVEKVIPAKPQLPTKPDTIRLPGDKEIIVQKVDTAKIIANYIEEKTYEKILFDDSIAGKFTIKAKVQYNDLKQISYDFKQKTKVIKENKKQLVIPFIETEYNSFGYVEAGGGIFIKNFGVSGKYVTNLKDKGFSVGLVYKF